LLAKEILEQYLYIISKVFKGILMEVDIKFAVM
jgi:hypothetical protein